LSAWLADVIRQGWRTLRAAVPGQSRGNTSPPVRFGELVVYRGLMILALVGLANSNPGIREMLDAAL
jgi:hypothetical protein